MAASERLQESSTLPAVEQDREPDYSEYGDGKVFTQQQLNKIVQDRLGRHRAKVAQEYRDLQENYERLLSDHKLGEGEREKLQSSLDEVKHKLERVGTEELNEIKERHAKALDDLQAKLSQSEQRYKSFVVNNAFADAAKLHRAVSKDQLAAVLKDRVKVVETANDEWTAVVSLQEENGKELPVDLAVARMKELPAYQNLFVSTAVGGIASNSNLSGAAAGTTGVLTQQQAAKMGTAEYFRARKARPDMMPWLRRR